MKEKRRLRREKNTAASLEDWALVREKMSLINRLGNDIKLIQKRQKRENIEQHCKSLTNEKDPRKFFQTFKLLADPIMKDTADLLSTAKVHSEFGGLAATSQEKANLFAERLEQVHQEPNYHGFSQPTTCWWKTSFRKIKIFMK